VSRGFSLIEVLVAVGILFFASFVFLSLSSNSYDLVQKFEKRNDFLLSSSLVFCEEKGGRLDEVVESFGIKNDKILNLLKKEKIKLEKRVNLKTQFENKNVTVYELKAFNAENSARAYKLEVK